ncbi:unnamed protein product [Peniophora sp. CBMAI 1063]|nr:unnamed protein product [Peniophora sp. CBMAI 1063]
MENIERVFVLLLPESGSPLLTLASVLRSTAHPNSTPVWTEFWEGSASHKAITMPSGELYDVWYPASRSQLSHCETARRDWGLDWRGPLLIARLDETNASVHVGIEPECEWQSQLAKDAARYLIQEYDMNMRRTWSWNVVEDDDEEVEAQEGQDEEEDLDAEISDIEEGVDEDSADEDNIDETTVEESGDRIESEDL